MRADNMLTIKPAGQRRCKVRINGGNKCTGRYAIYVIAHPSVQTARGSGFARSVERI